jgi:hypothetical protein
MPDPAIACGPDYPELLNDRAGALLTMPEGTFEAEAARLVPVPSARFSVVEHADWMNTYEYPPMRGAVERQMLGMAGAERATAMRASGNGSVAYAAGEGLPEDVRRYLAGAAAFAHGDREDAARRFASVLELPAEERPRYGLWAAFMAGRSASDPAVAAAAFQNVRTLVEAGADDPLGFAADSYGEEARLRLVAGDDAGAIALYAQQAALASRFGSGSLLRVARAIVSDPERLERDLADPLVVKLLTAYLATRRYEVSPKAAGAFLDAVDHRGLARVAGAGRLAAVAYRSGHYEIAERAAAKGDDGYAAWVRAKIALRDGDSAAAARAYAEAVRAFPRSTFTPLTYAGELAQESPSCRVAAEAGTLALARGEYVDAMENLYTASPDYWFDAAFVAERVLTLDELGRFVDERLASLAPPSTFGPMYPDVISSGSLRALYARRLLRADRYDDAMRYFDAPTLKDKAIAYTAALRAVESGNRIERAEQWWNAAKIARENGLDLLGYELDPDDVVFHGEMSSAGLGYARRPILGEPVDELGGLNPGPTADENQRAAASKAVPDARFHYRYVAVDFASRAADLVPARSQAYAAMLCQATGWIRHRNADRAQALYARYVANGPYVPWAANFGAQCEEPDFAGAAKRLHVERVAAMKRFARKAFPFVLSLGALAIIAAFVVWRRRATAR